MRGCIPALALIVLIGLAGCVPELLPLADGLVDGGSGTSVADEGSTYPTAQGSSSATGVESSTITGRVSGTGSYQLFDLGSGLAGDEWTVSLEAVVSSPNRFTVVLFDADYDLLMRALVSRQSTLEHVLRLDTPHVYLGVMPRYGSSGGDFRLAADLASVVLVPPPRQQVVYLNFAGGADVSVHQRNGTSFGVFDAGMLGYGFADQTELMKGMIVEAVREDYAAFDVVILTSDDGPPPGGDACATVHFGGADDKLLGLADSVDMYNEDPEEEAIVYVQSFAQYEVMGLEPDEMAFMVANVASHELGHLLGLYHTSDPEEIMDSTGTAWDLTRDQTFRRGSLEETVFPVGMEHTPRLLEQTVGLAAKPRDGSSKVLSAAKILRRAQIRDFVRSELRCRCGNCLNPDD